MHLIVPSGEGEAITMIRIAVNAATIGAKAGGNDICRLDNESLFGNFPFELFKQLDIYAQKHQRHHTLTTHGAKTL